MDLGPASSFPLGLGKLPPDAVAMLKMLGFYYLELPS